MAKLIDDTVMLDRIADEIVAGRAEHPTGAMRRLGVPDGSAEERRLLRKWASSGGILLAKAEERMREEAVRTDAYHRGWVDGWQKALTEIQEITGRTAPVPPPERRPSWLSRLFTRAV